MTDLNKKKRPKKEDYKIKEAPDYLGVIKAEKRYERDLNLYVDYLENLLAKKQDARKKYISYLEKKVEPLDWLLNCVEIHFSVKPNELKDKRRSRKLSQVRGMCFFMMRYVVDTLTTTQIGSLFNRDYSTVVYITKTFINDYNFIAKFSEECDAFILKYYGETILTNFRHLLELKK